MYEHKQLAAVWQNLMGTSEQEASYELHQPGAQFFQLQGVIGCGDTFCMLPVLNAAQVVYVYENNVSMGVVV